MTLRNSDHITSAQQSCVYVTSEYYMRAFPSVQKVLLDIRLQKINLFSACPQITELLKKLGQLMVILDCLLIDSLTCSSQLDISPKLDILSKSLLRFKFNFFFFFLRGAKSTSQVVLCTLVIIIFMITFYFIVCVYNSTILKLYFIIAQFVSIFNFIYSISLTININRDFPVFLHLKGFLKINDQKRKFFIKANISFVVLIIYCLIIFQKD